MAAEEVDPLVVAETGGGETGTTDKNVAEPPDNSLLAKCFPKSYTHAAILTVAFGVAILASTVPQGLGYGRFDTRADECYDKHTYYKFAENMTEDEPHCKVFSYPYRLVEPWIGSRMLPWIAYLLHQLGQWYFLRQAQLARDRGEIKWTLESSLKNASDEKKRAAYTPNR